MPELLRRLLSNRRLHWTVLWGAFLAGLLVFWAWQQGVDLAQLKAWWKQLEGWLSGHPGWLFAALVFLPGLPLPSSALLVLAGAVWSDRPLVACGICLLSTLLNQSWTYWVAAKPGRGLIERLIRDGVIRIPELPKGDELRLILILRLTPGMPLFVQNYVLGFLRVSYLLYAGLSILCTGVFASALVLSGAGIAEGKLIPVLTGVGVFVVGTVVIAGVRKRLKRG